MKPSDIAKLIIAVSVCLSAGLLGSLFTTAAAITDWYAALRKPFFTPPNWLFGPTWTTLYILMGISAFLVLQKLTLPQAKIALALFAIQLVLNALWTPLFFGLKAPLAALIEIILLWTAILLTLIAFARVSSLAALLLIPYLVWTTFAAVLNASIWLLNR